ncbi:MAG: hypothetical protein C0483_23320 [Pirellula sp.]|nr:hypothetical protein [Pirellula sp.]
MNLNRTLSRLVLMTLVAVTGCSLDAPQGEKQSTVKYQGETFVVVQPVTNFDATDLRKMAREEDAPRIEELMLAAKPEPHYASLADILAAMETIQFPEYARMVIEERLGDPKTPKDCKITYVIGLEVPLRHKDRYFTFHGNEVDGFDLVDEFVVEGKPLPKEPGSDPEQPVSYEQKGIAAVRANGKKFRYLDATGALVREK